MLSCQVDMILSNNAERVSGALRKRKTGAPQMTFRFQQLFVSSSFYSISRVLAHQHTCTHTHAQTLEVPGDGPLQHLPGAKQGSAEPSAAAQSSCLAPSPSLTQGEERRWPSILEPLTYSVQASTWGKGVPLELRNTNSFCHMSCAL